MKTDLYTKFVLTIIAISLCTIAVKNLNVIPTVHAQLTPEGAVMSQAAQQAIRRCWNGATIRNINSGELGLARTAVLSTSPNC